MKAWAAVVAALAAVLAVACATPAGAQAPYSRPAVDAPELAALGPHAVGVRTIALVEHDVPDVRHDAKPGPAAPRMDRTLRVDVWYPATPAPGAATAVYRDALPAETPGQWVPFTVAGIAVSDAPADRRQAWPLVVMSHGYSGTPAAMTWLAENLASKGYVVAAPHHDDPPITDPTGFAAPLLYRPLDIAFVAHALQARARAGDPVFAGLIDPDRIALAGYSMGGYGVLTAAGATIDPASTAGAPDGALAAYARGGAKAQALHIDGLRAVVAISPFGGRGPHPMWDKDGLAALRTPTLFIVGDQDRLVGYAPGVKSLFEGEVNAPRYLLVFENGAHSIGMNGAPESMRRRLWDLDWFEDPVWRKERVIGIELHMITAFLDLYVKGDQSRAAYLDVVPRSNDGVWASPAQPYDAFSPGTGGITVWKGFQQTHSAGLELHHLEPARP